MTKTKLLTPFVFLLLSGAVFAQENFCAICSREAWEGDSLALNKFMNGCGVIDTLGYDSLDRPSSANAVYKKVTMKLNSGKVMFSDDIYIVPDKMPEYVGGEQALIKKLKGSVKYPADARIKGVEGTVFVNFIVERDGTVKNVSIKKSVGSGCDEEAMRVIKGLKNWQPGTHKGKVIRVQMVMPVRFKLA